MLQRIIKENGGVAATSDFAAEGISKYEVAKFCKDGVIQRIRWGFYKLPDGDEPAEEKLVQKIIPQGIVCVESALYHYGYSDLPPREWSIAVPRTASRVVKNVVEFPIRAYYIQKDFFEMGKTTDSFDGVILPVYDRERTICDCFKYRKKFDDKALERALKAYTEDEKKNINNLIEYARKMNVYEKMTEAGYRFEE